MYNNFDSFIESVLGGANGLPKQASTVPVASQQYTTAPALTVEQAEQIARTQLSAEETAMAEMLGQMEAENTVKQASFINGLGGQQMNYGQYLDKQAGAPSETAKAVKGAISSYAGMAHGQVGRLGNRLFDNIPSSTFQDVVGRSGATPEMLGYGAIGAGALGLAGAGLGAKRIAAARRAAQAPVEQSIGRAVLNHLGRHKGKYAIGGAAALGLGGLMASKSASVDDMLWEKAASDGEAFLDQLASAALSDSTAQELQLFRAAALEAARY